MGEFEGKVVIVTGSSAGIGKDAVLEFAKQGACVVIHGQNEERLNEVVIELKNNEVDDSRILVVVGSMEDNEIPKKIISETVKKFGKIDVLVNNAGTGGKPKTDNHSLENFDFLIKVNLRSAIEMTQLAVPYLTKTKGNVVNISSAGALRAFPEMTFYCLTKAAMDHYTRNASLLYAPHGIRVNSVNPGPVKTLIFSRHNPPSEVVTLHEKWIEDTTPVGRSADVSEISPAILFLASDKASFVTGACWQVDGGHSVYMTPIPKVRTST